MGRDVAEAVALDPAVLLPSKGEGAHYSNYVRIPLISPIPRSAGQRPLESNRLVDVPRGFVAPDFLLAAATALAAHRDARCSQRDLEPPGKSWGSSREAASRCEENRASRKFRGRSPRPAEELV